MSDKHRNYNQKPYKFVLNNNEWKLHLMRNAFDGVCLQGSYLSSSIEEYQNLYLIAYN